MSFLIKSNCIQTLRTPCIYRHITKDVLFFQVKKIFMQVPILAVVGNDAGWTQIEREQVPLFGSSVACALQFTGEWNRYGHYEFLS